MSYSYQTFTAGQILTGAQMQQVEDNIRDHVHGVAGVSVAVPIGGVLPWAGTDPASPPTNWLICDGQAVSRTTYSALFAVVGTTYGVGDGSTTFNVPDLRGRGAIGTNDSALPNGESGSFSTRNEAATGGAETVTDIITHAHTQSHQGTAGAGDTGIITDSSINVGSNPNTGTAGSVGSISNMPPFIVLNFIIYAAA